MKKIYFSYRITYASGFVLEGTSCPLEVWEVFNVRDGSGKQVVVCVERL